jgi:hypothetical protein
VGVLETSPDGSKLGVVEASDRGVGDAAGLAQPTSTTANSSAGRKFLSIRGPSTAG